MLKSRYVSPTHTLPLLYFNWDYYNRNCVNSNAILAKSRILKCFIDCIYLHFFLLKQRLSNYGTRVSDGL